jgi:hypothetical protein
MVRLQRRRRIATWTRIKCLRRIFQIWHRSVVCITPFVHFAHDRCMNTEQKQMKMTAHVNKTTSMTPALF